jgi:hypothetical protein
MLSELGLTVARELPAGMIPGILSGAYSIHGGVIRDGLGRIVSHLATGGGASSLSSLIPGVGVLGSIINAGQIYSVGQDVKQVQQAVSTVLSVSMANTALAGIGLATSVAGFVYLSNRLNKIDTKLAALEKLVKEVRHLIESHQKAQLHTAIDCLRQSELTTNAQMRHELLMQSKSGFTTLAHYYRELLDNAKEIHQIDGIEEYYTLAFTGASIATSELGMADVAFAELNRHYDDWKRISRRHCGTHMLKDDPQRLLQADFVKELPTRELIETLDFVNDTQRGIDWIDDLRCQSTSNVQKARSLLPDALQRFVASNDEKSGIDFTRRLVARNSVLNTNVAHFRFLQDKKTTASQFSSQVQNALEKNNNGTVCIYTA